MKANFTSLLLASILTNTAIASIERDDEKHPPSQPLIIYNQPYGFYKHPLSLPRGTVLYRDSTDSPRKQHQALTKKRNLQPRTGQAVGSVVSGLAGSHFGTGHGRMIATQHGAKVAIIIGDNPPD